MDELVMRAKQGDEQAFIEIIISMENDLYKIARMRLRNDEDIEEAVQETCIEVFRNIKKLRENSYFKTWLIKILINKCNYIYKKNRKNCVSFEEKNVEEFYISQSIDIVENRRDFELLIEQLNYKDRVVITLFYLEGFSNKDISKILRIPVSTVKNRIARARRKLKDILESEENV